MDFITNLPPSKDPVTSIVYNLIFIIVDRYTKFSRYIPTIKTTIATNVAILFE
jgi:hypothetical protein